MITRLHKLFTKTSRSTISPTESIIAEGLVALLKSYKGFKENFIEEIIREPITEAVFKTGVSYPEEDCIIDIEISGPKQLIFIKLGIFNTPKEEQLWEYKRLLNKQQQKHNYSDVKLFTLTKDYCKVPAYTRYAYKLNTETTPIYWSEIAKILDRYRNSNALIDSYLRFFNKLRLGSMQYFTEEDLNLLSYFPDFSEKIFEMLSVIKSEFKDAYGSCSVAKEIKDKQRLIVVKSSVIKGEGRTEIGVGIYFRDSPCVRSFIYASKANHHYQDMLSHANKYYDEKNIDQCLEGVTIKFEEELEPLVENSSPKDYFIFITKKLLSEVDEIIRDSPNIAWDLTNN